MLAVHKPPLTNGGGLSSDILSCRGRSRQVSRTALARQASEERRASCAPFPPVAVPFLPTERTYSPTQTSPTPSSSMATLNKVQPLITAASPLPVTASFSASFTRTSSPSPLSSASMSPDQPESPPPPLSLEDQVHEAYALEDIHLAKILLLRLKGIEVTSDDDPRIAAVQDEDFDFCFLPNGPLLNEEDERALKELQARELERIEELRRIERMRMCERKWIEEKQRLREQRIAEFRRRERKRQEEERRQHRGKGERFAEEEHWRLSKSSSMLRSQARADRKFVNYDHLASKYTSSNREQSFVYDYMVTGSSTAPRKPPSPPLTSQTKPRFPTPTFDESRTISFKDVFRSMEGQLFPVTDDERIHRNATPANSRSRTSSRRRDLQLLDALLVEVEYTGEERKRRRVKGQERGHSQRSPVCIACSVCRSPLPSPSSTLSSSSAVSRTSSWLSFRTSSSLSSSCTDLTTPSSSPMTSRKSWLASRPQSWIPVPALTDISPPPKSLLRHSCRAYNRLTIVPLSEAPLMFDLSTPSPKPLPVSHEGCQRPLSRVRTSKEGAGLFVKRVSKIVELAKNIQSAYVTAALFSVTTPYGDADENNAFFCAGRNRGSSHNSVNRQTLSVPGSRVSVNDVKIFLTLPAALIRGEVDPECLPPPKYIPLTSPYLLTEPPRTTLPDPLPYRLHFKPIPQPIRSPFHHHTYPEMHTMYPVLPEVQCLSDASSLSSVPIGQLSWRIRCVGNPAYLRLKAVQNIIWRKGVRWEGCGRETAMGGGRERVVGIAYEGVRRSNLSCSATG